ncbi:chemotaxis protein CheD [Methylocapsa sp. S129]|uniref:chemotaxis protein CheD n=1 Tax=Methylocapsa sp. S129 TaxID=1641869 RepID=UPI00131B3965|nr:chemotaxis protein CheD [Methylocapsa sp. S129]
MRTVEVIERRIHVMQGEYCVSTDPGVMLTTLLGSCVAACMRDPEAQVGGMNHFLLPGTDDRSQTRAAESYGVHLMELLVNDLLRHGARRERLEAKLFGGSATMQGLCDIGALNSQFAERFLRHEGIAYAGGSLGGDRGRRIQFWPTSGRARQAAMRKNEAFTSPSASLPLRALGGEVELF